MYYCALIGFFGALRLNAGPGVADVVQLAAVAVVGVAGASGVFFLL